jgi:general secretion pathway protein G
VRIGLQEYQAVISVFSDVAPAKSPRVGKKLRNENRMISTLKKLQEKKAAQENNGGFTLIELLIVIVVLGILAAVVVFSLGGVAGTSAVAACKADGSSITTAIAAYSAQNGGALPASTTDLVGPNAFLATWPSNITHYQFAIATTGGALLVGTPAAAANPAGVGGGWVAYTGPGSCTGVAS